MAECIADSLAERFVLDHMRMKARPNASAFQIRNVNQWLKNANEPIEPAEVKFLEKDEDLIPVVVKEKPPLRRFIDRFDLLKLTSCLRQRKVGR